MQKEARPGAKRIGFLITDGGSKYPIWTATTAAEIRADGIDLIAVGIGRLINKTELAAITSDKNRVFYADNFTQLAILVNAISTKVCSREEPNGSFCGDCEFRNGVGYLEHPRACHLFYQCQEATMKAHLIQCPHGLFWSQSDLVCRRPANLVCPNDKCRKGNIKTYAIPYSCAGYWICVNKRTQSSQCCSEKEAYEQGKGCVSSDTCTGGCINNSKTGKCNSIAHESNPAKFYILLPDGRKQEMDCALGTEYERNTCNCSRLTKVPMSPIARCTPELYLPFDKDTRDHSNKKVPGGVFGNVSIVGIGDAVGGGAASFDGKSRIVFWRFSNVDFRQTLLITFRYREGTSTSVRNETIVSNSDCTYRWSVAVNYNRLAKETVAHIKSDQEIVQAVKNTGSWKNVELKYDQGKMTLKVNGAIKSTLTEGNIARSKAALQIGGKCETTNGFTGYIDEFYLYKCF